VETLLALVVGGLYATAVYLMLRRSLVKLILGLALLGHAANLLIFTSGGLLRGRVPLVQEGASRLSGAYPDPLPQALILTAIVISFGVLAFGLVLLHRVYRSVGTDDVDRMRGTQP
jgi:multicomponent Na+:H+ antiporter subunit C